MDFTHVMKTKRKKSPPPKKNKKTETTKLVECRKQTLWRAHSQLHEKSKEKNYQTNLKLLTK